MIATTLLLVTLGLPAESASSTKDDDDLSPSLLSNRTFLLPGAYYAGWVPTRGDSGTHGGGIELSIVHHSNDGEWSYGAFADGERVGRWRTALGFEAGYEFVGLEVAMARELSGPVPQWEAQIAPYFSFGFVNVVARWVIALDHRGALGAYGDGAMITVGAKVPIVL